MRRLLTTGPLQSPGEDPPTFIFAVNAELHLRLHPDGIRSEANAVKHESLFHNEDVLAAGEIQVTRGVITSLNDVSGSYATRGALELATSGFHDAVREALVRADVEYSTLVHRLLLTRKR